MRCFVCENALDTQSLASPVDYEYGVNPAEKFSYYRCANCSSEWLQPRPDNNELPSFYPDHYHAHSNDHGLVARLLVRLRSELRGRAYRALLPDKAHGSLFDVGAGDCRHFVELNRFATWKFAGVEIQPAIAERARQSGFDIETGTLEQMDISAHRGKYDVVSMNHVLEHVRDPQEVAARCYEILKPGGWLIGQLPTNSSWESRMNHTWAGYHFPRHLQIFSRQGLQNLLEKAGFHDVQIKSTPHCQTAISLQNALIASGIPLPLTHGRSKIYGALLLLSLPFETIAWLCDKSGTVDFKARR